MRVALVVTTYERPDALARALDSAAAQTRAPDELAVADDGSGPATAAVVAGHARRVAWPVHHARQPHEGFRAARARNLAIARTHADYVILVDGDMVLDRDFVADHARAARPGTWVQGCRLPLDRAATHAVLRGADPADHAASLGARHRLQARRVPRLTRLAAPLAHRWLAVKACNQGIWRADLERVNGFDERYVGWGAEDKDLGVRLGLAGVRPRGLPWAALAWHLAHPPAARDAAAANLARLAATRAARVARCETGLDRHTATG